MHFRGEALRPTTNFSGANPPPLLRSMTRPAANRVSSSNGLPMSCRPERQALAVLTGGHDDARQTGHVDRHREHVVEIHLHRIRIHLLVADTEGGGRRGRGQDGVDAVVEDGLEIAADQGADLLRLDVIGVVIAGREHIGADHHTPLHFAPKTFGAGHLVHVGDVLAGLPEAVLHAVIAGEIGRGLRRGDNVIGRQGIFGVRQRDVL